MEAQRVTSDDHIKHDILDSLLNDSRLDASGVNVDVTAGAVYLTGVIPSLVQKRIVREIVGRTKGVLDVDDELQVVPISARSDADIERSIYAALVRDVLIDETKIDVHVTNGVVELSGTADSFTAKRAVEEIAWATHGVVDVEDHIIIEPHTPRSDDEIAEDVHLQLDKNLRIGPGQLHIEVHDGVVRLDGRVATIAQRWLAEELARWVPGVVDVENNLESV